MTILQCHCFFLRKKSLQKYSCLVGILRSFFTTLPVQSMQFTFKSTSTHKLNPFFLCNDDDAMRKGKNEKIAFSLEWIKKNLRWSKSHWDFHANHLRRHLRMEMHLSLHHAACQHVIIIYNDTGEFPYSRT